MDRTPLNEKAFYECHLSEDSDPLLHWKYTLVKPHRSQTNSSFKRPRDWAV